MTRVAIFGSTSAIARASARRWHAQGASLCLVARSIERAEADAADLRTRGGQPVFVVSGDASRVDEQEAILFSVERQLGPIDIALVAFGVLPDPARTDSDLAYAMETLRVNFTGTVSLVSRIARLMQPRGNGTIAVISSVAGDRGRGSNAFYGAAKGGLTAYLSAERSRLAASGVHVVTIKPGFVASPMTAHIPPNALFTSPERVGAGIVKAVKQRRDVVYLPWFWRWIMLGIRMVPERIFKRLTL